MFEPARPLKQLLRDPVDPARTQAVWQRLRERRERRALPTRPAFALGLTLASALVVVGLSLAARRLGLGEAAFGDAPRASALRLQDGGAIPSRLASGQGPRRVVLSDASSIELAPGAELRALRSTARVFETELLRGGARFEVTPGGPRRWSVRAGRVEVRVVGTRFRVEHVEPGEVEVSVEHGVVSVTGVTVARGERRLVAGEHLRVLAVPAPVAAVAPAPVAPAPASAPPSASAPRGELPAAPAAKQATPTRPPPDTETPRAATADELLAAADRHRAEGDHAQAALVLERLLEQHPRDSRAPLAALTLGRLHVQLGHPAAAVSMLEHAQQLGLPKALAEEGAAFLVLAHARAGDAERARVAAERYRTTFPRGRWSASVRQWAGGH